MHLFFILISLSALIICDRIDALPTHYRACEATRIPWCIGLYDSVYYPNHLGHRNQEDAYMAMHQLWPLIKYECSPQILHLICRLYAPQCPYQLARNHTTDYASGGQFQSQSDFNYQAEFFRPPCEDTCQKVRHDCHRVLAEHYMQWPDELECSKLRNSDCFRTPDDAGDSFRWRQPDPVPEVTTESPPPAPEVDEATTPEEGSPADEDVTDEPTEAPTDEEPTDTEPKESSETDEVTDDQEPSTVAEPTTGGSLLGISPVIPEDRSENSDEDSETPNPEDAESTPTGDGDEVAATDAEDTTSNDLSSDENQSPRSDRAIGSGAGRLANGLHLKLIENISSAIIYFVIVSTIFHRHA